MVWRWAYDRVWTREALERTTRLAQGLVCSHFGRRFNSTTARRRSLCLAVVHSTFRHHGCRPTCVT
jgi:hypothetical protein